MAKTPKIEMVRKAVVANCGGHENSTDAGIRRKWLSLDPATRAQYLASVEDKPATAGTRNPKPRTESDATGT